MQNYYKILNVMNFAETEVIKASYKALIKKYHPDVNKDVDPSIIIQINEAYEILSDEKKKTAYDQQLKVFLDNESKESTNKVPIQQEAKRNVSDYVDRKYENTKKIFNVFRIMIFTPIFLVIGTIVSEIILNIVTENNWSFLLYVLLGGGIGYGFKVTTKSTHKYAGYIACVVTIICIILPMYSSIHKLYIAIGGTDGYDSFITVTSLIIQYMFTEGWLRAILMLLAPICAFTAFTDD